MKKLLLTILLLSIIWSSAFSQDDTWITIFDGKSTKGWKHVGDGKFELENGLLKTIGGMGLLFYEKEMFSNVRIKVVYQNVGKSNSGVFIRIPEKPTEAWMPVNKGYEVQIDDNLDPYHSTGALYSLTQAKGKFGKSDQWNTMVITLDGTRTIVEVNGNLVTDYNEGDPVPEKTKSYEPDRGLRPIEGYIGLQNHGGEDLCLFKEVSILRL